MADSDDEYDKKRRDKFQGERTESYRDRRKDDDWGRSRIRSDYRDRYSYQNEVPPPKRIRYENDDVRNMRFQSPFTNVWGPEPSFGGGSGGFGGTARSSDLNTQPPMMPFKSFLQTQDDNITDEEAIAKYAEYKLEFQRQQLNEFFVAHKEEEWFKLKYHPEDSAKRKEEMNKALKRRAQVFLEMLDSGRVDAVQLGENEGDAVVKLLDAVVIRLEGGTELDLTVLDLAENASNEKAAKEAAEKAKEAESKANKEGGDKEKPDEKEGDEEKLDEVADKSKDTDADSGKETSKEDDDKEDENVDEKKGTDVEMDEPIEEKEEDKVEKQKSKSPEPNKNEKEDEDEGEKDDAKEEIKTLEIDSDKEGEVVPLTPRPLHKTTSIFLRSISPRATKSEIEAICKKYPGFLRVSLSDATPTLPTQRWFRRGWVTFRRDVNIKEICWNLNSIRVRDCELGAIVNRDLNRRVRSVSALSAHKIAVLNDLKLAARIIQELDSRHKIWDGSESSETTFGLNSANPVLKDITEYLVEEASVEEEELLGQGAAEDDSKNRYAQAVKVLDRLLLYLRIVYSVDYYNMSQYVSEDENPNRCGIMHLRGMVSKTEATEKSVTEYCEQYRTSLDHLMRSPEVLGDSELVSLGAKSEEVEVEKFIHVNTKELSKDRWLCPLSGKKFKGPQFVRKHIYNKYSDQLDEVKKEVEYFNNYLRDPKRPQLPEHPGNRPGKKDDRQMNDPPYHQFQYSGPAPGFKRGFGHFGSYPFPRGRGGLPPRGRSMDYRPLITYRDLDAPCEPDEII